jgi:hypothetical protein
MRHAAYIAVTTAASLLLTANLAGAGASALSGELVLSGGYFSDGEWVTERSGAPANAVGFEYYRKVGSERGDFLTIDVQARVSYDSSSPSGDRWGLEIHNAWAEYKLGLGRNIMLGHFAPGFGLEPVTDTHGTVLQTLAMWDLGFKKDWGAAYRGILGPFDLTVAGQLGTGMGIRTGEGSFLLTAQVWEPPGDDFRWGLSAAAGEVLPGAGRWTLPEPRFAGSTVTRYRAGAAAELSSGSFLHRGEVSLGADDGNSVAGALTQSTYVPPSLQSIALEAQARAWTGDVGDADAAKVALTAGASWRAAGNWTLRAYLHHDFHSGGDTGVLVQAYYFGG